MGLYLKPNEICPYQSTCPYARNSISGQFCQGTIARGKPFCCDYVKNGRVQEGHSIRNRHDQTGKMRAIQG